MGIEGKRGQAMIEMAAGMLALALVVSALCVFAVYIARSLRAQNTLRTGDGGENSKSDSVEVGDFAAKYFAGAEALHIRERVKLPERTIVR